MEMPIIRPSKVSYADEINFAELLAELLKNKHNGYIRVTSGPNEGYILFKDGKQIASSYDRYSKSEAIEKIKSATEASNTVIEVFDLRQSHVDYLIDINKFFLMESDYDVYQIIDELKSNKSEESEESEIESTDTLPEELEGLEKPEIKEPEELEELEEQEEPENTVETAKKSVAELVTDLEPDSEKLPESDSISVSQTETAVEKPEKVETETPSVKEPEKVQKPATPEEEIKPQTKVSTVNEPLKETSKTTSSKEDGNATITETTASDTVNVDKSKAEVETSTTSAPGPSAPSESDLKVKRALSEDMKSSDELRTSEEVQTGSPKFSLTKSGKEITDRSKLLERYGIKDVNEEDVEVFLDSYKGGYINDEDVEKIELTLMNKIKKSMLEIPKIKGAEVMVFMDNTRTLSGTVNIITDFESKGFFSRLIGESTNIDSLRRQIINIVEIELKRSFREYPEIINNFDINLEIG